MSEKCEVCGCIYVGSRGCVKCKMLDDSVLTAERIMRQVLIRSGNSLDEEKLLLKIAEMAAVIYTGSLQDTSL